MSVKKTKKKRGGKVALAVLLVLLLGVFGTAGFLALKLLDKLQVNPGGDPLPSDQYNSEEEPEDPLFDIVYDVTDATNLKSFLSQWWSNGGDDMIRYSKDVVNVLLVGVDNNEGEPGTGRSDTIMLASVNKKTRTITLLSFLRDSYCYYEINGEPYYNRINTSFYYGGPAGLMETISRLYKIRVDKYITVDFRSFPKLIDALGGVAVDVTEQEAKYINRTAPSQNHSFPAGEGVRLTGNQALVYSRIRKLDSDLNRTNRQQKVIKSIIEQARGANMVQLYNALDVTLEYVGTNYTRTELLGLIPSAMGWLNFEVVHMSSPIYEGPDSTAIGGTINGMSILIIDYPKAAQQVQLALYGESNIDLQDDAHRNAYIEELFAGAGQRPSYYNTVPQSTEPEESEDYTEPEQETTRQQNQPIWPFWPWGGGTETTTQGEETYIPQEETEPATQRMVE